MYSGSNMIAFQHWTHPMETPAHLPKSLWAATAPEAIGAGALPGDLDVDVTIVGAGFTGLRAALVLAQAGTRVAVLEAGDIGWGASGRNGGQVNPMLPFNGPDRLKSLVGSRYLDRLAEVSLNSADELFELIRTHQIACDARQNGWLRVDHCRKVQASSRANAERWNQFGANMTYVSGSDLHALTGSKIYHSGVLAPKGGAVQPLALARGVARAAHNAGAQIFTHSPVTALAQDGNRWVATTRKGRVRSHWVILATNGYTGDLLPGLSQTIIPICPVQIATDPLPDEVIREILPKGQTISDTRRVIMYARREPDNRMVFGGHGKMNRAGEIVGHDWLIKDAMRIFPQLRGVDWSYRWGGTIAITQDRLPHLHEPKPGLLVGLGYNGRGVAMSHVMGRVLAERVLGAAPDSLPFPVTPVRPIRFRGSQMLGKGLAIGWMKLLDRIETAIG